jgi:hypothetical protein
VYINKKGKDEMEDLMLQFLLESDDGKNPTPKSERIMSKLYRNYIDKIINGVIFSPKFRLYTFGEPDDLFQVGRMEVYKSIVKKQWNADRGSIFNFITTVVKKNLTWHTLLQNKKNNRISDLEFEKIINSDNFSYVDHYENFFVMNYVFDEIKAFFIGKSKMERLAEVFIDYWKINSGKKFIKKNFIEYASTYTFSPSLCHAFFSNLKKIVSVKKIISQIEEENSL